LFQVDVSYGGENGFSQAIELSSETLGNVKFIQEKKLIGQYFDEISQDTGKYCFGVSDTFKALDMGAVETLIVRGFLFLLSVCSVYGEFFRLFCCVCGDDSGVVELIFIAATLYFNGGYVAVIFHFVLAGVGRFGSFTVHSEKPRRR
jgi:hypothetical protein